MSQPAPFAVEEGYTVWHERLLKLVNSGSRVVYLDCDEEWGSHYLISEMDSHRQPSVWLDLDTQDLGVAVGNKISDALERAFGFRLFGYGLPLQYCLKKLADASTTLGAYKLIVTGKVAPGVDLDPMFALPRGIVLGGRGFNVPSSCAHETLVVTEDDMRLSVDDAHAIAQGRADSARVLELLRVSGGRYEPFLVAFQDSLGLPPPERPYPDRFEPLDVDAVRPNELIDSYVQRGLWIEAFELAARSCVARVPALVDNAAEQYWDRGLVERFADRLIGLPNRLLEHEDVVYWLLSSSIVTNTHRDVIPRIKDRVDVQAMPNVRAVMAIQELTSESLSETQAALSSRWTLVTARAHAFCMTQFGMPEAGLELLMSALSVAQSRGRGREIISISSNVALAIALKGDYRASLSWAEWSLAGFRKYGVHEEIEQLYVKSQVQYMRLLSGVQASEPLLSADLVDYGHAGIPTFEAVVSTIGDFEYVEGRYEAALAAYERNREFQSRDQAGHFTLDSCRALLALGRGSEARALATGVQALVKSTNRLNRLKAQIANGMTLASVDRISARAELAEALDTAMRLHHWDIAGLCAIGLAGLCLLDEDSDSAAAALGQGRQGIQHLGDTGWLLLGSWLPNLEAVRTLWREFMHPLDLSFLGTPTLTWRGTTTSLTLRNAEVLAVLALSPGGLSGEQLADKLYEGTRSASTLKATLSRLRTVVPIRSQPYAIAARVTADVMRVESLLGEGKTAEALREYAGPLLPGSSAPAIVAHREYLEEAVRQSALGERDVDAVFAYAQRNKNDLEVWEWLMSIMQEQDTRTSFVKARVLRLREEWGLND